MKKLLIATVGIMAIFLQGCVSTTEKDLVENNRVQHFCHDGNFDDTIPIIEERLLHCYGKDESFTLTVGVYAKDNIKNRVIKRQNTDGSIVYIHTTSSGPLTPDVYGFRLHFKKGDRKDCPMEVTTHAMNFAWERHVERVKLWLSGEDMECQVW